MTSTSRLRLALRELADLAGVSGAEQPSGSSWPAVELFVRTCFTRAAVAGLPVPSPLDDLQHWRALCDGESAEVRNVASGVAGQVLQARDVHGDVHLHSRPVPAARSAYLEQVRRIAPDDLYDRDGELAELADWCRADGHDGSYVWWQAPAWAGKSALMSWFVLHPPPGVRVVSFFVTARLSSQNHKTAFAEVVLEQLAELLDLPLPELLTDATRDAHLLGLLAQAAAVSVDRGERLVLVVDGLDEDRGVTVGPDAHSIAALLPARPAAGLRIVVAGRPQPPIPADVPDRHPLRDSRIIRRLDRSRHADVVREDAQRELTHLLRGDPAERDLLGLVAAAGGGLTGDDLAALTGWPEWEVAEHLHAVSGRTFGQRTAGWAPDTNPPVYLLAHEQLQQNAIRMLGPAQVAAYRDRLHLWADRYRDEGWPIRTPEYLLRGYFRLLRETGDTARMVRCALDRSRHRRMLDLTGGNGAALTEIAAAQEALDAQPVPDLLAMLRLTIYRAELHDRNYFIPAGLPQAWARLGHQARAEALAWSLPDPVQQTKALIAIGVLTSSAEDPASPPEKPSVRKTIRADGIQPDAKYATYSGKGWNRQQRTSIEDVTAAIAADKLSRAEALARAVQRGRKQWLATHEVVKALTRKNDLTNAERVARTILDPRVRAQALTGLVIPAAEHGERSRAEALATEAESLAQILDPLPHQPEMLIVLLRAVAVAGDLTRAERLAGVLTDTRQRGEALAELVALMAAREDSRAEDVASTISEPFWRARALVAIHLAAAWAGDAAKAARIVAALPAAVGAVRSSREQAAVWAGMPMGMALLGDRDGAESLARAIPNDDWRDQALADLASVLAAKNFLDHAESVTATITDERRRAQALVSVGVAAVRSGDIGRGEALAERITDPRWRVRALTELAAAAQGEQARRLAGQAEAGCESIVFTEQKAIALGEVATALALSGDQGKAEEVARSIVISRWRDHALAGLVSTVDQRRALALVDTINDLELRAQALIALAARSPLAEARQLIASALRLRKWTPALDVLARIEPDTVLAVVEDFLG